MSKIAKMPLREHILELRRRLIKSVLAVLLGTVIGWLIYDPIFQKLQFPINNIAINSGKDAELNFSTITSVFDLKVQIALFLGIIFSSPIWIYQIFAFVNPALNSKEKKYVYSFVSAAVPLFLLGAYLGWFIFPNVVNFLINFTPDGASNIINVQEYLTFVLRFILIFGIAFLLPIILVGVNFSGQVSGKQILHYWRIVVFGIFLFSAMATPSSDVISMFFLAVPMLLLFFAATTVCLLHDRRKNKKDIKENLLDRRYDSATLEEDLESL